MDTEIIGDGHTLPNGKAKVVAGVFDKLRARGDLTAARVLKEASRPTSYLHQFFEWDDTKAAAAHRLTQAGALIRAINVRLVGSDATPRTTRAYVHIEGPRPRYDSTLVTLETKEGRRQLLAQALAELERLQEKYRQLEELTGVFAALKKVRRAA